MIDGRHDEMDNAKMIKTVSFLDTLVKVLGGILRVFGIIFIVFALLVAIIGDGMFETGSFTLDLDFVKIHMTEDFLPDMGLMKVYACIGLLVGSAMCFVIFYITKLLRKIFAPMKEGRPFEKRVCTDMRKIAWAILIGGGINEVLKLIEQIFVIKALPMDRLFSADVIASREYSFQTNGSFILLFFVIMFLSYIFSYGQSLQQEADETI